MSRVNENVPEIAGELMPELEDGFFDEDLFDEDEFMTRFSVMTGEELDREAAGEDAFSWDYAPEWEDEFEPDTFHPLTEEELDREAALEDSLRLRKMKRKNLNREGFPPAYEGRVNNRGRLV